MSKTEHYIQSLGSPAIVPGQIDIGGRLEEAFQEFARAALARINIPARYRVLLRRVAFVGVLTPGVIIALAVATGASFGRVLTGFGLLSVALGFALKNPLENMVSGVLTGPFRIGDEIEVGGYAGVVRENKTIIPKGDTELRAGDHVFLISERKNINRVVRAVSTDTEKVDEVMIFGGGKIGLRLALILEQEGISVKLVEKDEERAQYAASRLRKSLVLHDEGISRDFLLQERVDRTGAFIAATGDDRANLLAVMYAKQLGAKRTISVVSREEFAPLSEALGVDIAISPRLITAGAILRFVRKGDVMAVNVLESGAEMIEMRVPDKCPVANRPLSEVGFPEGAIVGAVMRDGEVVIPTGAEVLRKGDDAVVFTVESAVDEVERLFAP